MEVTEFSFHLYAVSNMQELSVALKQIKFDKMTKALLPWAFYYIQWFQDDLILCLVCVHVIKCSSVLTIDTGYNTVRVWLMDCFEQLAGFTWSPSWKKMRHINTSFRINWLKLTIYSSFYTCQTAILNKCVSACKQITLDCIECRELQEVPMYPQLLNVSQWW